MDLTERTDWEARAAFIDKFADGSARLQIVAPSPTRFAQALNRHYPDICLPEQFFPTLCVVLFQMAHGMSKTQLCEQALLSIVAMNPIDLRPEHVDCRHYGFRFRSLDVASAQALVAIQCHKYPTISLTQYQSKIKHISIEWPGVLLAEFHWASALKDKTPQMADLMKIFGVPRDQVTTKYLPLP